MSRREGLKCNHNFLILASGAYTDCTECGKKFEECIEEIENITKLLKDSCKKGKDNG